MITGAPRAPHQSVIGRTIDDWPKRSVPVLLLVHPVEHPGNRWDSKRRPLKWSLLMFESFNVPMVLCRLLFNDWSSMAPSTPLFFLARQRCRRPLAARCCSSTFILVPFLYQLEICFQFRFLLPFLPTFSFPFLPSANLLEGEGGLNRDSIKNPFD